MADPVPPFFPGAEIRRYVSQDAIQLIGATPLPPASGLLVTADWPEAYGYDRIAVLCSYVPAAPAGAFTICPEWLSDLIWYADQRVVPTVAGGPPPTSIDDWLTVGPFPVAAAKVLPLQNPGGCKSVRFQVYESGAPATPGTISIAVRGMG